MTIPNETNPLDVLTLAMQVIKSMDESQASPGEKAAALKTAAFAIEQAASAQQLAVVMSNLINQTRPK